MVKGERNWHNAMWDKIISVAQYVEVDLKKKSCSGSKFFFCFTIHKN